MRKFFLTSSGILLLLTACLSAQAQSLPGAGNSLTFDGSNTVILCGNSNRGISNQVTAEAWVKTTSSAYQWVAAKYSNNNFEDGGFFLYLIGGQAGFDGRCGVGQYFSSGHSATRYNDGRWHHLAGVFTGTDWRIYVDGLLVSSSSYTINSPNLATSQPLVIGYYAAQNGQYFNGEVDEVRIWRTAKTASEIQDNMCRKITSTPALVAHYRFDQSSGPLLIDQGSQPIDGVIAGFGSNPWHLSGAALGDVSTRIYHASGLVNSRLALASARGDSAIVTANSLAPVAYGVQLYAVNSPPSIPASAGSASNYFGVFMCGSNLTQPTLPFRLRLRPTTGPGCQTASQRGSNDQNWTGLPLTPNAASLLSGPLANRGEYILAGTASPPSAVIITGDSAVCAGNTGRLTAAAVGATAYRWNNGATTPTLTGIGPGTYVVSVSFASGCATTAQSTIRQARSPTPLISGDSVICPATAARLIVTSSIPATYRWSTGATTSSIAVAQGGTYSVTATSAAGCEQQTSHRVRATVAVPRFSLGADTTLCEYEQLILSGPSGSRLRYQWSDGSTGSQLLVRNAGVYSLRVSNECGTVQATRTITGRNCIVVPNIVTPNNDTFNDFFAVQGLRGDDWELAIYNRWGRTVLQTRNYHNNWGSEAPAGIYYVLLHRTGTAFTYKGWVEVVR